ncbi:uncharacterized protein OCT59_021307 [Rhizophagus irregularis]|uniref:uncharacterized protein n=1 Tax=Rhizophagus irregularis TaxID=588596 RepID=UPI00332E1EA7|nr:hypothetical protein OCT59_021307 [Rhizophagus irregularis]
MEPALNLLAANNPNVRQRYLTDFDRINIDDTICILYNNPLFWKIFATNYNIFINNAPHLIIPNMVFLVVPHVVNYLLAINIFLSEDVDFQFLDTQELSGKEFVMQKYYLTDEEFVSKEDLATARLYFKRPGRIRRLQHCLKLKVLTSDYWILYEFLNNLENNIKKFLFNFFFQDNIGKDKDSWKTVFHLVGLWSWMRRTLDFFRRIGFQILTAASIFFTQDIGEFFFCFPLIVLVIKSKR